MFAFCDAKYRYVNEDSPSLCQFLISLDAFIKPGLDHPTHGVSFIFYFIL